MRTSEELRSVLEEHLRAIEVSAASFDAGELWEAKRIANSIYTLVHDTRRSTSVLTHLGLLDNVMFLASGKEYVRSEKPRYQSPPLVTMTFTERGLSYMPRLSTGSERFRWLPFAQWWAADPVYWYKDPDSTTWAEIVLNRKDLVCSITDQDGGRHLDKSLKNEAYQKMKMNVDWVNLETGEPPKLAQELVTVRQIGWELVKTIRDQNP